MRKIVFVASSLCSLLALTGGGVPAKAADLDWRSDRGDESAGALPRDDEHR